MYIIVKLCYFNLEQFKNENSLNPRNHFNIQMQRGKEKGQKQGEKNNNTDFNFVSKLQTALKVSYMNLTTLGTPAVQKQVELRDMKCNFHI